MADALRKNPLLDAIYAGYPDGEFVLFRSVRDPEVRKRLNAPQDATMVVQSITLRPDGAIKSASTAFSMPPIRWSRCGSIRPIVTTRAFAAGTCCGQPVRCGSHRSLHLLHHE